MWEKVRIIKTLKLSNQTDEIVINCDGEDFGTGKINYWLGYFLS